MLSKKYRLQKRNDIRAVFKRGRSLSNLDMRIQYLLNQCGSPRVAFIVSNKVSKSAVVRNTLRRRLRVIISLNLEKISKNFDIIVSVSPRLGNRDFFYLKNSLENLLERAKIISEKI